MRQYLASLEYVINYDNVYIPQITMELIELLNWTAFSTNSNTDHDLQYLMPLQDALIDKHLCVLPDIQLSTMPRIIFHPSSQESQPDFRCFDKVLYVGPAINRNDLNIMYTDCNTNRTILTVDIKDGKWSKFCLILLQQTQTPNIGQIPQIPQVLFDLCSVDYSLDTMAANTAINSGNIITGVSFILRQAKIPVKGEICAKNNGVIPAYICSMFRESEFFYMDPHSNRINGKEIQITYKMININEQETSFTQLSSSNIPKKLKNNIDCGNLCHLCYKCSAKGRSSDKKTVTSLSENGDLFIVGLFPLHTDSAVTKCDLVNSFGQAQALAFLHAINEITSSSGSPKQMKNIRTVVMDTCSSNLETLSLLHSINSCKMSWNTKNANGANSITLQPGSVIGQFLANSQAFDNTIPSSKVSKTLIGITRSGFSQVFDHNVIFVQHLLTVLERIKWTVLNIIISPNVRFQSMSKLINELSVSKEICFVKEIHLQRAVNEVFISAMRQSAEKSSVFLLLTSEEDTHEMFSVLEEQSFDSKLQFIFTPWNKNLHSTDMIQIITDENIILQPLLDSAITNAVLTMRQSVDISNYQYMNIIDENLDFEKVATASEADIGLVISSVRQYFRHIAMSDDIFQIMDDAWNIRSTGLEVIFVDAKRRQKIKVSSDLSDFGH